jgi:hypothetical protein
LREFLTLVTVEFQRGKSLAVMRAIGVERGEFPLHLQRAA